MFFLRVYVYFSPLCNSVAGVTVQVPVMKRVQVRSTVKDHTASAPHPLLKAKTQRIIFLLPQLLCVLSHLFLEAPNKKTLPKLLIFKGKSQNKNRHSEKIKCFQFFFYRFSHFVLLFVYCVALFKLQ